MYVLIKTGLEKLTKNPEKVRKNISKIVQMEKHQVNIQKQLDLIKQMKRALILNHYFKNNECEFYLYSINEGKF